MSSPSLSHDKRDNPVLYQPKSSHIGTQVPRAQASKHTPREVSVAVCLQRVRSPSHWNDSMFQGLQLLDPHGGEQCAEGPMRRRQVIRGGWQGWSAMQVRVCQSEPVRSCVVMLPQRS